MRRFLRPWQYVRRVYRVAQVRLGQEEMSRLFSVFPQEGRKEVVLLSVMRQRERASLERLMQEDS